MVDPRRFLFFATSLRVGGAERVWASLLPELAARGAEVKLVTLNDRGATFELLIERGIDSSHLDAGSGLMAVKALPELLSLTRNFKPDVIVSFEPSCHGLAAVASRLVRVPHVLNWHQGVGLPYGGTSRLACRVSAALGSGVIAASRANFGDVAGYGFALDRMAAAPNGVPRPTKLVSHHLDDTPLKVCVAARLAPEKRLDVFVEAMALLRESVPDVIATVMGDGPLRNELEALARRRKAPITFTGTIAEPMEVMVEHDVACLTSDRETTPMALMEAAACGLPVVTTDAGAVREMVVDGETAIVCDRGDARGIARALEGLAADPDRRMRMSKAALKHWERNHSIDAMVDAYWHLLTTLQGPPASWPPETNGIG